MMSNHYGVANTNNHRGGGGGGGRNDHNNEPEDAEQKAAERNLIRRCIDYHGPAVIDVQNRLYYKSCRSSHVKNHYGNHLQPHSEYLRLMGMPTSTFSAPNPSTVYCTYLAHVTRAKNSTPIMCLSWTPGGRRLLTGNQDGEFTLWDGITFSFELIMSAHDVSFRSMAWSHNRNYLLTSDAGGNIKYWSPSIAPVKSIDSHNGQPIHGLSFSPSDTKFVSCGDDSKLRVWDWATASEERCLEGHGWDVKSVQWHPRSSVIASGSKDNLVKLWDPRSGTCLSTLYGHKNTVTRVAWNNNGNWLLSSSRDQLIKLYDIRTMKELASLKGHNKEVTSVAWHPTHESVLASGSMDGMICFWNLGAKGSDEPAARIPYAHDMAVWSLEWHPAGHMLASGSNDRQTKFWARNRVGSTAGLQDTSDDKEEEMHTAEIELGNHVGIVIGRKGATIISMQRSTGCKMYVDQVRRVLLIQGTEKQIDQIQKRVGALLDRVSNEEDRDHHGMGT